MDNIIDELGDFIDDIVPDKGKKPVNHVAFLIDISGSMMRNEHFIIDNFNEHLKVMREQKDQDTFVTLIFFNDEHYVSYYNRDISEVVDLTIEDIKIGGSTALYDTLGVLTDRFNKDIDQLRDKKNNCSALVIVITDGADNVSRKYNYDKIKGLMKELETYETWTFTFAGVDFDVIKDGNISIKNVGNTIVLNSNNLKQSIDNFSRSIDSYYNSRSMGYTSSKNYFVNSNNSGTPVENNATRKKSIKEYNELISTINKEDI